MPYVVCDITGHIRGVTFGGIGCASRLNSDKGGSGENGKVRANAITHAFVPLAFESLGAWGVHCQQFVSELGRRITIITGDARETSYLRQRLSIAVQKGNAIACRGTLSHELDN